VPLTREMTPEEIRGNYEANTGKVIVERLAGLDPAEYPAVLVYDHGPFAWGRDAEQAVHHAVILEHLARLASETVRIEPYPRSLDQALLEKHFRRKHGPGSYYGQEGKGPA
jgi:L-ribulose-5-phosphate 4-epimerase